MNKKELKFYEAPALEVVELKTSASLMVTSPGSADEDVKDEGEIDLNQ
jgi:hypothetical protein